MLHAAASGDGLLLAPSAAPSLHSFLASELLVTSVSSGSVTCVRRTDSLSAPFVSWADIDLRSAWLVLYRFPCVDGMLFPHHAD